MVKYRNKVIKDGACENKEKVQYCANVMQTNFDDIRGVIKDMRAFIKDISRRAT